MRLFVLAVLSLFLLTVQSVLLPAAPGPVPRPDLLLLLVMVWTAGFGPGDGVLAAGLAGGLADVIGAGPPGAHILALLPGILVATMQRGAVDNALMFAVAALLAGTVGYYLVLGVVQSVGGAPFDWWPVLTGPVPLTALVNCVFTPALLVVAGASRSRSGPSGLGTTTRSRALGGGDF